MRIGLDATVLYIAQAGVFYYNYNLLRALLAQDRENQYTLVDYYPTHGGWTNPPEAIHLEAPNARLLHVQGLRHRRLSRLSLMQKPVLKWGAWLADQVLFCPWAAAAQAVKQRQLAAALDGVDVFHSSDVLLWKQPGALNVVTIHDLTVCLFPQYHTANTRNMLAQVYRFAQEQADLVIAVSESTKRDIVAHLNIPPSRIRVVYEGVDACFHPLEDRDTIARALEPLRLEPRSYILHVGTIEPRKNLVCLVEAYALLRKRMGRAAPKLALVGRPGWLTRDLHKRVADLDLRNWVAFLGGVPGNVLPHLYNGAQLLVYPSLYEGFGLPILEAMACGTPVITSNVSSLPEVAGHAALLIDPHDMEGLASMIEMALSNADLRADLRRQGLAHAARFSWERAARETLAIYATEGARLPDSSSQS